MKRAAFAIVLALVLPACDDKSDAPTAPSATPPPPVAPAPPASTPVPPPVPSSNQPPVLRISIRPDQPSGPVPREVNVNMCGSTDPEGERMIFEYKWGGTGGEHFTYLCRGRHVYEQPGSYRAFFCVHDEHDHRVCANQRIDITL